MVKRLKGLLPICASCNKIRDDQGEWNPMETYISENTEAMLTHGLCPTCFEDSVREVAGLDPSE